MNSPTDIVSLGHVHHACGKIVTCSGPRGADELTGTCQYCGGEPRVTIAAPHRLARSPLAGSRRIYDRDDEQPDHVADRNVAISAPNAAQPAPASETPIEDLMTSGDGSSSGDRSSIGERPHESETPDELAAREAAERDAAEQRDREERERAEAEAQNGGGS